jgi:nucleoside-diphosphate-sugar epimerase
LGAEVHRGDLFEPSTLDGALEGVEQIYHLAGGVRGAGKQTADLLNRQATASLLEACRGQDTIETFLLASSCAVYGDRSGLWVDEDHEPYPNTEYGRAKVSAEGLVQSAVLNHGLPAKVARIGAVYGRGFSFFLVDEIQNGKARLPGEGRNCIPVIHVQDCVAALQVIAEKGQDARVYHVADQSSPTLKEFYGVVHKQVGGQPVRFWSTYVPSYVQRRLASRNERLQSRFGRKPRFTPDTLDLFTNSVRLRTERLAEELSFEWQFPDYRQGVEAALGQ